MAQGLTTTTQSQQVARREAGRAGAGIGRTPTLSKAAREWLAESASGVELSRALGLGTGSRSGWH